MYTHYLITKTDITTDPDDELAAVGTSIALTCNAAGADDLIYHWVRMGDKSIPMLATGVNTNTLTINNVTVSDSGKYNCIVSSNNATVTSECGAVSVVGKLCVIFIYVLNVYVITLIL